METPNLLVAFIGVLLLVLGRRLYWLFVSGAGFLLGFVLAGRFFTSDSQWLILIIALLGGLLGTVLAVFLQRFAVFAGGFLVGAYIAYWGATLLGWSSQLAWLPVLIGGFLGAGIVAVMFEPALVLLSSIMGASLVVQSQLFGQSMQGIVFLVLVILGIVMQSSLKTRLNRPAGSPSRRASRL